MNKNILAYRGYSGAVEFSSPDDCFFGRVLGIRDIVSFEGGSVAELRRDFEDAVDDYLAACGEIGKTPEHPCSGKLSLRIPVELHQELTLQSEISGESINNLIAEAVETLCKSKRRSAARSDDAVRGGRRGTRGNGGRNAGRRSRVMQVVE